LGQGGYDLTHILDEAHIQHPVHLIQDEILHALELDDPLIHQVQQPSGRGYQYVNSPGENPYLGHLADAPEYGGVLEAEKLAVGGKAMIDLGCQLSGGGQHQHPRRSRHDRLDLCCHPLQYGQHECGSLACSGLSNSHQVLSL